MKIQSERYIFKPFKKLIPINNVYRLWYEGEPKKLNCLFKGNFES